METGILALAGRADTTGTVKSSRNTLHMIHYTTQICEIAE